MTMLDIYLEKRVVESAGINTEYRLEHHLISVYKSHASEKEFHQQPLCEKVSVHFFSLFVWVLGILYMKGSRETLSSDGTNVNIPMQP